MEPANKYSVVCSTTLLIQHETFMFSTHFEQSFFFLHILVGPTSFVYEKYFIVASTVHSVKHD